LSLRKGNTIVSLDIKDNNVHVDFPYSMNIPWCCVGKCMPIYIKQLWSTQWKHLPQWESTHVILQELSLKQNSHTLMLEN